MSKMEQGEHREDDEDNNIIAKIQDLAPSLNPNEYINREPVRDSDIGEARYIKNEYNVNYDPEKYKESHSWEKHNPDADLMARRLEGPITRFNTEADMVAARREFLNECKDEMANADKQDRFELTIPTDKSYGHGIMKDANGNVISYLGETNALTGIYGWNKLSEEWVEITLYPRKYYEQ
jgi:hypothetical protein